jgi:hypothetical protein
VARNKKKRTDFIELFSRDSVGLGTWFAYISNGNIERLVNSSFLPSSCWKGSQRIIELTISNKPSRINESRYNYNYYYRSAREARSLLGLT